VRKRITLVAVVALVLGVVGGTVAFSANKKSVTLSVDGKVSTVQTSGGTVREVLDDQDIDLGTHDAVAPSLASPVSDGSRIAVRYGRDLNLTVDGRDDTYWVTATSVDTALDQIGLRFAEADLSASRSAPIGRQGIDLTVKTEKTITLVNGDREKRKVSTTALTAAGALKDLDVDYDGNDEVEPGALATIDDGSKVRVVRIAKKTRRVAVEVPNETVVRYDDSMLEGREKVRREGRDGVRVATYKVVLANGERRDRHKIDTVLKTEPVTRVEVHGTKEPPEAAPTAGASGGGVSDAPCPTGSSVESGLTSNAIAVHRAVCHAFPEVDTYGGLRVGDDGEHGEGRALDIMVYSDSALGDSIAQWLQANAGSLGISELIWSQQIWTVERGSEGWRWMGDMGSVTANHYDHVHATVY
jgi:resuscitation-promoting factor RpfB